MCRQRRLQHDALVAEVSATVVVASDVAGADVVDGVVVVLAAADDELAADVGLKALFDQASRAVRWARRLDLSID